VLSGEDLVEALARAGQSHLRSGLAGQHLPAHPDADRSRNSVGRGSSSLRHPSVIALTWSAPPRINSASIFSTRHLSYLENGRAAPSGSMALLLAKRQVERGPGSPCACPIDATAEDIRIETFASGARAQKLVAVV